MKIIHISDIHGSHHQLKDLPKGDVLVHSGDLTMTGSEREALDFLEWFCELSYPYKIFICGNHDECLYGANIEGLSAKELSDKWEIHLLTMGVRHPRTNIPPHPPRHRKRIRRCY